MIESYFARIEAAGIEAAIEAMTRSAERVSARAKQLAPVRKVFEGQDDFYQTRLKSIAEIRRDRPIRARLGLGPENAYVYPPSIVSRRAPQMLGVRKVETIDEDALTRRGRYELHSGRSITDRGRLGGRLRDEIQPVPAQLEGHIITARVESPTPYAKFQEFGTRHNPAHPYLRPAGQQGIESMRADVRASVVSAARAAAKDGVRLKPAKIKLKGAPRA